MTEPTWNPMAQQFDPQSTLTEWLLARIGEDEAVARAAIEPDQMYPFGDRSLPRLTPEQMPDNMRGYLGGTWGEQAARWSSLRVLAECEAKRAIVDLHGIEMLSSQPYCTMCGDCPQVRWPCETLRILAEPYRDHPGWREEWAQ